MTYSLWASTQYEESYKLYKMGKYNKAFSALQALAQQKDYDAAYLLASMYEKGQGCKKDYTLSQYWYKVAAKGYFQEKDIAKHYIDKEKMKLYERLDKPDDPVTEKTIKKLVQSIYNMKAHKTNYFLPMSYKYNGKYQAFQSHNTQSLETEFQISFKYNIGANVLGLGEIYSAAYTQKSFWQLYEDSAYFRETNYNPELFMTLPLSLEDFKFLKVMRFSFAHQSNGRGGVDERSWNYFTIAGYFQHRFLFSEVKFFKRLPDPKDYNPELTKYIGTTSIRFIVPYKKHLMKLSYQGNFHKYYGVEFNYSHPTRRRDDLFFYFKVFQGYGESLISYNKEITKVGFGFSISR